MYDIIDKIDFILGEKLANKSSTVKKQRQRQYYARNKTTIQNREEKFEKSIEGKKREKKKERMEKANKTPTGRKKVNYRKHQAKRKDGYQQDT